MSRTDSERFTKNPVATVTILTLLSVGGWGCLLGAVIMFLIWVLTEGELTW